MAALKQFPTKERQILDEYADLTQKHSQGDLSDLEFANRLETNVVVPWRELTEEMSEVMKQRLDEGRRRKFEQYMRLRQESFEDLLASVRNNDKVLQERAREKQKEASRIVQEMNGDAPKDQ